MRTKDLYLLPILTLLLAGLACGRESPPILPPADKQIQAGAETLSPTVDPAMSGPCANVLYPFVPGRQWVYQELVMSEGGMPAPTLDPLASKLGITVAEVTGSQVKLNAVDLGTGTTTQTTANCQNGAITDFPLMTLGSLFGNYLVGDIQITYVSGTFSPSKTDLDAAGWRMEWQGEYIASGTVTLSAEGEQTTIILNESPVRLSWKNDGQETITVPAGTYENAYRVERTSEVEASLNLEGITGKGTITVDTIHWFAPYIGLLKTEVDTARLSVMGVSFPVEAAGSSLILVEYKP